jgi:hypothetical protein
VVVATGLAGAATAGAFVCASTGSVMPSAQHSAISADGIAAKALENSGAYFMIPPGFIRVLFSY